MSLSNNKSLTVAIRADSSFKIGAGHLLRCLTLADNLKPHGVKIHFLCLRLPGDFVELAIDKGYCVISKNDLDFKVDWLVVDHYGLDKQWESEMRTYARRIVVIDDLADREHDCDILLDQTLDRKAQDYEKLVPKTCRLLLGSEYAVLAAQFSKLRPLSLQRRLGKYHVENILVSMGGTDPYNVSEFVINSLQQLKVTNSLSITLGKHVNQSSLANMMMAADLAIGAGGVTSWERCCLGLPTIMITTADNQFNNAYQLDQSSAIKYLGNYDKVTSELLNESVHSLMKDSKLLEQMSIKAATICDGYGVRRVVLELLPQFANDGSIVRLRQADMNDGELMLTWQQDPSTRQYARNPRLLRRSEHFTWLKKRLDSADCIFNIILYQNNPAGVLRLDKIDNTEHAYEISILTAPKFRRLGLAGAALRLIRTMFPDLELRAEVLSDNKFSHALFLNEGYQLLNGVYVHKMCESYKHKATSDIKRTPSLS